MPREAAWCCAVPRAAVQRGVWRAVAWRSVSWRCGAVHSERAKPGRYLLLVSGWAQDQTLHCKGAGNGVVVG